MRMSVIHAGLPIFAAVILLQVRGWAHLEILAHLSPKVMGALTLNGLVGTVLSDLLWAQVFFFSVSQTRKKKQKNEKKR